MKHAKEGDCALFAKEIAASEDAVIPILLAYRGEAVDDQARCVMGLELLAHFLRAQNSPDYAQLLAQYINVAYASQRLLPGQLILRCFRLFNLAVIQLLVTPPLSAGTRCSIQIPGLQRGTEQSSAH